MCALVGVLFVLPVLFASPSRQDAAQDFLPHPMVNVLTEVRPPAGTLPPAALFGLLRGYALLVLAAGGGRWPAGTPEQAGRAPGS